jgi:hypothetical protein
MTHTVFGIFTNRTDAEEAIEKLGEEGYDAKDISIIMKDRQSSREIADTTGANVAGGAITGATTGAALGGLAGLLASFVLPGIGAFFIGGPIAAALGLTGAAATTLSGAATGAVAGGLVGALTGFGLSEEEARVYETRVNEGAILIAVPTAMGEQANVEEILSTYHADDIKSVHLQETSESTQTIEPTGQDFFPRTTRPAYAYSGTKGGKTITKKSKTKKSTGSRTTKKRTK